MTAAAARAIELSLEENRAERGSVGYVDMTRLFKTSPDAARAKEGLEELVRQAEERVNSRKAELLRLRSDLGKLNIEREYLAKSTPTVTIPEPAPVASPQPKPAAAPVVSTIPVTAAPPIISTIPVTAAPPAVSTNAAPAPPTINLPGLTDAPLNMTRPGAAPLDPARDRPTVATTGPNPLLVAPVVSTFTASTAPPAGPTAAQRLIEFDGLIVGKQVEVDRLQAVLDGERLDAERSLLDAEGRKTDQVLARLYRAISEVAKREGVSVVVDKSATLYGHPAVDLTDKILKQLKGQAPSP